MAAFGALAAYGAPQNIASQIKQECIKQWLGNPEMVSYCMTEQAKAFTRVNLSEAGQQVKAYCKSRFGSDFTMVDACIKNSGSLDGMTNSSDEPANQSNGAGAVKTSANGVWINTCSHGSICHGELLDAIRLGN